MAETSVVKEFLVRLGYKSDEQAMKKFEEGIAHATKAVVGFALAVEATAVAVSVGVAKFASNLEALYFASIRTGTAAGSLKAFDRAAQSFGASAGAALSSAESLARFFRQNPAGGDYINSLLGQIGESAYDKTGKLKEMPELLTTIGKLFNSNQKQGMGFMNYQISDMLGIDEKTMLAIQDGSFARKYADLQKQINTPAFQHATEGAHAFMESLRRLQNQLYILGVQIVDTLQSKLHVSLDGITRWLSSGGGQMAANMITEIVGLMIDEFNKLLDWWNHNHKTIEAAIQNAWKTLKDVYSNVIRPTFEFIYEKLKDLDTATGGWSTKLFALAGVLKAVGLPAGVAGIAALALAFGDLGKNMEGMNEGAKVLGTVALAVGTLAGSVTALAGFGVALGGWFDSFFPNNPLAKLGNWIGGKLFDHDNPTGLNKMLDKYALKPNEKAGILANIYAESGGNSGAGNFDGKEKHLGLFQFGADWQAKYQAWAAAKNAKGAHYTKYLDFSSGESGAQEQLDFFMDMLQTSKDPGMQHLRSVMQANRANSGMIGANEIAQSMAMDFEKPYSAGKGLEEEADKRGKLAVQIVNNFDVKGAHDPVAVQRQIEEANRKSWQQIAREHAAVGVQ